MTTDVQEVIAGVDTHADTHHAAVIDTNGKQLGDSQFPATNSGYQALYAFLNSFGTVICVGVEGTGSYGAGLFRYLRREGRQVLEVIRPNRQVRRMRGKSDPIDAYAAAAATLAGSQLPVPKSADGPVEAIRYLLVTRRSAVKARSAAQVQIKSLLVTAPEALRQRFRGVSDKTLIQGLARMHLRATDPITIALKSLARRHRYLTTEIVELESRLARLVADANSGLVASTGIGTITAAQLLITAGDNPERLHSEAAFAALCGASPIPASSGKTTRHRLNRAIAREVFTLLTKPVDLPRIDDLRLLRQERGISQTTAAAALGLWPGRISDLELGRRRNDALATTPSPRPTGNGSTRKR